MLPFVFEWQWDIGHIVFFGLFFGVVSVVFGVLGLTILKTILDLWSGKIHSADH
ncbi:MAG: hypothetical protein AB1814_19050 [Thermodesulfobacteriota bacterium]